VERLCDPSGYVRLLRWSRSSRTAGEAVAARAGPGLRHDSRRTVQETLSQGRTGRALAPGRRPTGAVSTRRQTAVDGYRCFPGTRAPSNSGSGPTWRPPSWRSAPVSSGTSASSEPAPTIFDTATANAQPRAVGHAVPLATGRSGAGTTEGLVGFTGQQFLRAGPVVPLGSDLALILPNGGYRGPVQRVRQRVPVARYRSGSPTCPAAERGRFPAESRPMNPVISWAR